MFPNQSSKRGIFAPPTPFQQFLWSPLKYLTHHFYFYINSLSQVPIPPHPPVRVVCISDTHNRTPSVPDGDLLIHAGDLTNGGTIAESQAQIDWPDSLPHKHKVAIASNHDAWLDAASRSTLSLADQENSPDWKSIRYMQSEALSISFTAVNSNTGEDMERMINIYAAPHVPLCGGTSFAFQYQQHLHPWQYSIPKNTNILVTHTPPRYYRDISGGNFVNLGCQGLLEEIWRVKPKLHVFGHVHVGRGRTVVQWDRGQKAYEKACERKFGGLWEAFSPRAWMQLWTVVLCGVWGILKKPLGQKSGYKQNSVLVNAAMWYDLPGNLENPVQLIDI
ncbi:Metallo-dependent phosphatase [Zopfia rhizophila CBS 207.26]|uniref:Metallo-dependent phosphatase n=1 Tax=Zopfia rhizophila CBS 207.26 TaxID=1314779 RepID=A0A6A6EK22_9PEZI|nr:Metallo-dependent phosphatase [Zopfia rhizophila CBS 207.26]